MNCNGEDWTEVGDDERKKQVAIRYYCRHLVSLAGSYQPIDDVGEPTGDARGFSFSGFLIYVGNCLNLVTAGHILADIDGKLKEKQIELTSCVLIDGWGIKAKYKEPIPFLYEDAPKFYVHNEEYGLDFGFIVLSEYYEKLLAVNEVVVAIPRHNWIPRDSIRFNEYIMLGLPTELINDFTKPYTPLPAIIPLTRLDSAPEGYEKPFERFVGKIFDNVTISDMDGMSGGPIFGIGMAPDGRKRYWTVAVQSSWLSASRITFGCPTPVFMGIVEKVIAANASDSDQEQETDG